MTDKERLLATDEVHVLTLALDLLKTWRAMGLEKKTIDEAIFAARRLLFDYTEESI